MGELVVETEGLRKRFGDKLAVADLSLSLKRGEVFGFLGPNGAGKTTCLKMLLGLVEPSGGRGRLLGAPLGDRATRARVGFLPEHFRFQDWLTGRELLRFHGRLYGMGGPRLESRIEELLARVDLLDAAHRPFRTYSKGMSQRVGLAQALLNRPEVVFLDEPTSGLDPLGRLLVRDVIGELRGQGTSVFLNSHLLGEVEATCDRVGFVKQGRTVHELALAGVDSGLDVEVRLGAAGPDLLAGLGQIGGVEVVGSHDGVRQAPAGSKPELRGAAANPSRIASAGASDAARPGATVRLRVASDATLPKVARWLVGQGAALYEMHASKKPLEAWFLEVMGEDQRPG
jgi:ABC-2 type transport system ATP-binding protein